MDGLLDRLTTMKKDPKFYTHFHPGANFQKISIFEKLNRITLPKSYKTFLTKYNGGMMVYDYQDEFLQSQADYELYKGDSVYLFSIEELKEKYEDLKYREWKVDKKMANPYPIIPFCSLPNNELLVFIHGKKSGEESPVFDAFHEEFPSIWGIVAPDFTSFFAKYIEALGHPETIGNEKTGVASDYFDNPSEIKETPEEILIRTELELQKDPDYAFHHYERAEALMNTNNFAEAYISINKAIEIDSKNAFYYYFRGEILNETKQYRAALVNYDIAVKLKPDDTFYLSCRAGSLFRLNKLTASLKDCNQAIQLNPKSVLPYMMRKEIYLLMGMKDKAEADQIIIDQLKNNKNE